MWEEVEPFLKVKKNDRIKNILLLGQSLWFEKGQGESKRKRIQLTDEARISYRLLRASVVG
jgi:hypothetical protein